MLPPSVQPEQEAGSNVAETSNLVAFAAPTLRTRAHPTAASAALSFDFMAVVPLNESPQQTTTEAAHLFCRSRFPDGLNSSSENS
jgi:hypothetical protein